MYAKTGVIFCPGEGRHLSSPIVRGKFQNSFTTLWRRNLNKEFLINRETVKKRLHSSRVPICFMDQLPAAYIAQQCLHHLNTDILLAVVNPAIDNIRTSPEAQHALHSIQSASDYSSVIQLRESLTTAFHQVEQFMSHVMPSLDEIEVSTSTAQQFVDQIGVSMASDYGNLSVEAMPGGMPALLATIATSTIVVSSVHESRKDFSEGRDLPLRYDAGLIAAYFKKRPMDIAMRSAKIMFECSSLTFNILWDKYVGREQEMEKLRARQLVELITRLGPTAVKVLNALQLTSQLKVYVNVYMMYVFREISGCKSVSNISN